MGGKQDDTPVGDPFPEEEPTRVDLVPTALVDDSVTPIDVEACHLCGAVCVIDDFDLRSLEAFPQHCIRARDGHWWYCSRFRETNRR